MDFSPQLNAIAQTVLPTLPQDWNVLALMYEVDEDQPMIWGIVQNSKGERVSLELGEQVLPLFDLFEEIRQKNVQLSGEVVPKMRFQLASNGKFKIDFTYDDPEQL